MKVGEEFKHNGKTFIAVLNLIQVLSGELSCTGCYFWNRGEPCPKQEGADKLLCGNRNNPIDEQTIFVEKV